MMEGWRVVTYDTVPTKEGLAYRPDAGVFPFAYCPPRDADGEEMDAPCEWFTWDGYETVSEDMPTHWMPFPPDPITIEDCLHVWTRLLDGTNICLECNVSRTSLVEGGND